MGALTVVYDTNVFVSGFCFDGKPERCFELAVAGSVDSVISTGILHELVVVLGYERLPVTEAEAHEYTGLVVECSRIVEPTPDLDVVADDPDDDKFVECAVAAEADYVVSGDDDLLTLGSYEGIEVVSPDELLDEVDRSGRG